MSKAPFILCRCSVQINDDELDVAGLLQSLTDIQGQYLPHGRQAEQDERNDVVVMRPQRIEIDDESVIA